MAFGLFDLHGARGRTVYLDPDHGVSPFGLEGCDTQLLGRDTIHLGGLLHEIYVLLVAHSGYGSVVLHAYEQTASVVVGKG